VSREWIDQADCAQVPLADGADPWFPLHETAAGYRDARMICAECPVRRECLTDALARETKHTRHGMLGGLTPSERARIGSPKKDRSQRAGAAERRATVLSMHARGFATGQIAKEIGTTTETVLRHLREHRLSVAS
jgi:hypothetical protein